MSSVPGSDPASHARVLPLDTKGGRVPPHSTDAEEAVLGAMLLDREAVGKVLEILDPECFYHERHISIFKVMLAMFERGVTIDLVTLSNDLQREGTLERVGGMRTLTDLSVRTVSAANVEHHARIVLERYLKRQLIQVASEIISDSFDETTDALDEVDRAEQRIFEVAERRTRRSYSDMKKLTKDAVERIMELASGSGDGVTGVPTGFSKLDELLSGFQPSDLIILAARPSMGKTALALNMAEYAAVKTKKAVAVFSMEMSASQLAFRLISSLGRVNAQNLRTGRLEDEDWSRVTHAITLLAEAKIFIDDTPALSPTELRSRARRLAREHSGLGLIVIDYLQLMQVPGNKETRATEIAEISRSLKALAKELHVPVIALSQLNRSLEQRTDKRPVMSDLRESGGIEQDADLVLMIYRDEYYNQDSPDKGLAEIIITKQRNGPTGTIKLAFQGQYTRFDNYASESYSGSFE